MYFNFINCPDNEGVPNAAIYDDDGDAETLNETESETESVTNVSSNDSDSVSSDDTFDDPSNINLDECNTNDDTDSELLFPGASISVSESMLLTLSMYLRHDISDSLLSDMLKWLEIHCPKPNHCAKSLFLFQEIYDGSVYQNYLNDNSIFNLNCPNNISFIWNSDGIPLFKSSKVGVWPLFLQINELPIQERNKVENMILVGLWSGSKKPFPIYF
ncbi:hypothetical protein HCN44_004859 [Aphidius gifuensis]|uniref:Uncharacterized protein n=1 Tax=Aphidius gifuensis TaxID=684658 RepID=A0A834XUX2_APHGI|nr:hypothetical protein HCN44_004859 [Aphidius gifuensis]